MKKKNNQSSTLSLLQEDRQLIIVGICAQWKKVKAKPMEEILQRLEQFEFLRIIVFSEEIIYKKPIEEWPFCHVLISFHSKGFPLPKTQEYARLRQPYMINDLDKQWDLMDRIRVHEILQETGIPQPRYGLVRRRMTESQFERIRFSFSHLKICFRWNVGNDFTRH